MDSNWKPDKRLYVGESGTGKTTMAVKEMRKQDARWYFVYDPESEFVGRFGGVAVGAAGLDDAVSVGTPGAWICYDPSLDVDHLGQAVWQDYGVGTKSEPGPLTFFSAYILALARREQGRKVVFIDELDIRSTNNSYPAELVALVQTGRKFLIDGFFCSSTPNGIHNRVFAHMTELTTFRQSSKPAMDLLAPWGITPEEQLALGQHGWWRKNKLTGKITQSR